MKLDEISIPKPCDQPWDAMRGGDKARFCESCQHDVHDLSAMTRREAEALLASDEDGSLCVRYRVRGDEIVFQPESSLRLMAQIGGLNRLLAAAALVAPLLVAGCDLSPAPEATAQAPLVIQEGQPVMLEQPERGAARPPAPPVAQAAEPAEAQESCDEGEASGVVKQEPQRSYRHVMTDKMMMERYETVMMGRRERVPRPKRARKPNHGITIETGPN